MADASLDSKSSLREYPQTVDIVRDFNRSKVTANLPPQVYSLKICGSLFLVEMTSLVDESGQPIHSWKTFSLLKHLGVLIRESTCKPR